MKKIAIREDLYNQYINSTSTLTFKELEENYNNLIDLINMTTDTTDTYVICLIDKDTLKYISYCVGNKFYINLQEAIRICKDLNYRNKNLKEEYCVELVQNKMSITILSNIAYNMLKE